ncbi:MAG: sigma-70 family RNA polymerase sigma factor [Planctomycetes bacterium]|nr:sigma-70 family RNA polymerase sigma factor [Planctomycetota bacterium]
MDAKQERAEAEHERVGLGAAEAALQRWVDEYGGQLYSLGLRFCGHRTEAEDLVQEVFLQAYRGWSGYRGASSPKTWLYTIAARACQRMQRKRAGEPDRVGSIDELLPFGESRIAADLSDQSDVVKRAIRAEARERVESAIASLPDEFRVPLILKDIVELTVPEVADILGLEEGTVRSRVHRARLKLRATVDALIPRAPAEAPAPAYSRQVCLDLLDAKQSSIDRGVPFDSDVICQRCRSVFSSLDLTRDVCRDLATGALPPGLRERLATTLARPA